MHEMWIFLPRGIGVRREGPGQVDDVGHAVVVDVGEADLVVDVIRSNPFHRFQM